MESCGLNSVTLCSAPPFPLSREHQRDRARHGLCDAAGLPSRCRTLLTLLNAMPRIALAPLFLLWFGLGIGSKVAGRRQPDVLYRVVGDRRRHPGRQQRSSGAVEGARRSPRQVFFKVTLPSAVPVIFSGLRLGLIFALLGVVGAELIAAEHGLGQTLAYLRSTFHMDGVMGILPCSPFSGSRWRPDESPRAIIAGLAIAHPAAERADFP